MSRPVRRSQAISPFGIGALVDFPGPVSLVHAGLDAWPFKEGEPDHREFIIDDEKRLSSRLDVDYFVQPPDFRQPEWGEDATQSNLNMKLPFLRFPLWHVCPRCGRMHLARYQDSTPPTCKGPIGSGGGIGSEHSPRKTVQVRFVGACKKGHLQDFPWLEWLFKQPEPLWEPEGNLRWLRMRSTGSASLTGVEVAAEERLENGGIKVVEKRTLSGAFQGDGLSDSQTAFGKIGVRCEGHNPALGIGKSGPNPLPGCGQEIYPLLRGASNLYFPQVVSSIYIPNIDDKNLDQEILDILDDHLLKSALLLRAQDADNGMVSAKAARIALKNYYPESVVDAEVLAEAANRHILKNIMLDNRKVKQFLSQKIKVSTDKQLTLDMVNTALRNHFSEWEIDPLVLLGPLSDWFEDKGVDVDQGTVGVQQDTLAESDYRREEYRVFCRDIHEGYPKANLLIRSSEMSSYGDLVRSSFERVSLLHKLRETRAFVGFSRIYPGDDLTQEERWKLVAQEKKRWLPAVIVRGEGIFLKFREDRLRAWIEKFALPHESRFLKINQHMGELRERRHQQPKLISPKHVLIHTFAHLLINELVYECGYGSASLRERIYSVDGNNPMSGVLIYTAAGDSEGSMGGLVQMGQPGYLEAVVARALEKASWCSSDPVCIESKGQGPDNCNLAACHSCALLPETSCEEQNRLLDRGVVIGTIENPSSGFFHEV
jgi:hypothetical protein